MQEKYQISQYKIFKAIIRPVLYFGVPLELFFCVSAFLFFVGLKFSPIIWVSIPVVILRAESKMDTEDEDAVIARSIAIDPDFLLQEGTYIPCSLTMRFVSEVAGRIQCLINQDIYGSSGRVKLIERGTKAIGVYQSSSLGYGMARMHVIWTKLLTPDYKRVNLVDTQAVGRLGEAGIDGRVNSHFAQKFGGALMVSLLQDVVSGVSDKHAGNKRKNTININTFENTKDSTTSIVERMLDASVNIPPTMYKKQGDIIGIEVVKDIDFSKIYKIKAKK